MTRFPTFSVYVGRYVCRWGEMRDRKRGDWREGGLVQPRLTLDDHVKDGPRKMAESLLNMWNVTHRGVIGLPFFFNIFYADCPIAA